MTRFQITEKSRVQASHNFPGQLWLGMTKAGTSQVENETYLASQPGNIFREIQNWVHAHDANKRR